VSTVRNAQVLRLQEGHEALGAAFARHATVQHAAKRRFRQRSRKMVDAYDAAADTRRHVVNALGSSRTEINGQAKGQAVGQGHGLVVRGEGTH